MALGLLSLVMLTKSKDTIKMSTAGTGPVLAAATSAIVALGVSLHNKTDVPTLPAGFPAHLSHKMAWTGADFNNKSDHIFVLSETHIAEIKAALEAYKGMSFHFGFI